MNLYMSDLHFGHKNVIRFDNRPFCDVDEMDRTLIANWNNRVSPDDDIWIVGDFCYRSEKSPDWYLRQLSGHKHLIIGNHDKVTVDCANAAKYLESVENMTHLVDELDSVNTQIILCHFPFAEWNGMRHGSHHIFGHIHNKTDGTFKIMKDIDRAYNAGCMINGYAPVSLKELVQNNLHFRAEAEVCTNI